MVGALFIAREPVSVARGWAADRLAHPAACPRDRISILSGRAGAAEKDRGAIVCACFEVGVNEIVEAITRGGCLSVEAVGAKLKAGSNCGSCRSEIGRLVHDHRVKEAV
jgi:assimilatory nitrate reductase catalytic subunit